MRLKRRTSLLDQLCGFLAVSETGENRPALAGEIHQIDWLALVGLANDFWVTAILCASIEQKGLVDLIPDDAMNFLRLTRDHNNRRNGQLRDQTIEAIGLLNKQDITPLVLKGAHRLLLSSTDRMIIDIDLLVPQQDEKRSYSVLERFGYETKRLYRENQHTIVELEHPARIARIDLHRGLIETLLVPHDRQEQRFSPLEATAIWRHVRSVNRHGVRFVEMTPEMQVIHMALHDQIQDRNHYLGGLHLSHMHDLAVLIQNNDIDWKVVRTHFESIGMDSVIGSYLSGIGQMFGAAVPVVGGWSQALHRIRRFQLEHPWADPVGEFVGGIAWEMALWRYSSRAARRHRIVRAIIDHRLGLLRKFNKVRSEI